MALVLSWMNVEITLSQSVWKGWEGGERVCSFLNTWHVLNYLRMSVQHSKVPMLALQKEFSESQFLDYLSFLQKVLNVGYPVLSIAHFSLLVFRF